MVIITQATEILLTRVDVSLAAVSGSVLAA